MCRFGYDRNDTAFVHWCRKEVTVNILSTEEKIALKESAGLLYTSGQFPLFEAALPLTRGRRLASTTWLVLTWAGIGGIGVLLGLGLSLY